MALTAIEYLSVRRHAGYPAGEATDDPVAAAVLTLTAEAEGIIRTTFLPPLNSLEQAIIGSGEGLDTNKAAVWERNPQELLERSMLYRAQRLALCAFLGVPAGPGVAAMLIIPPVDGACPAPCSGGGVDPGAGVVLEPPAVFVV
jgi:hypothetical protein